MSSHHDDELPSLDTAALTTVTGGAGLDASSMLPLMLALRNRQAAAPPPPPAQDPWKPKIMLNGVEQPVTSGPAGTTFNTTLGE